MWSKPAHWAAGSRFCLVVLAETGRQPIDNPDTHLELTMVHEGPLLEYAGRELAYLQWAAAARHWIVLVLACELVIPHPGPFAAQLAVLAGGVLLLCVALAVCETVQAKMRMLRVPLLLGFGRGAVPAGARELVRRGRRMTGALIWGLLVSSLAVIVVRRRSIAIVLVALQSLVLGVYAITQGSGTSTALAVAGRS